MGTQFLVIGFRQRGRKLVPDPAKPANSPENAKRAGARLAPMRTGVVVLRQEFDETADFAAEPVVIAKHGELPPEFQDASIAA